METAVYSYQSAFNNFIPFTLQYQQLSSSFKDSVSLISQFNTMFKNSLREIIKQSVHVEIPTLRNLYEEVIFLLKESLTKTINIESVFQTANSQINLNSSRLNTLYDDHFNSLKENSTLFEQMKNQLRSFKQSVNSLNDQILVITQSETVNQYYNRIYKQGYITNGRGKAKIQNQLKICVARMECSETNLRMEFEKNMRLFGVLSYELEEVMVNATLIEFSTLRQVQSNIKTDPKYPMSKVSSGVEGECLDAEQEALDNGNQLYSIVQENRKRLEILSSVFEIDQLQ